MARVEIKVPDLGMESEAMQFGEWLKQAGDQIIQGEDLFEVEADKATVVCEAERAGILSEVVVSGGNVKTGDIVGYMDVG